MVYPSIRLLHITDPHLHAHPDSRMRGLNTYETFCTVIKQASNDGPAPDAILATGDLVQDETREGYMRFREVLESLNTPVYCLPGNHDAPNIMAETLDTEPFHYCGSATFGNWCIVLLNSACRLDDGGRLSEDELERLEITLKNTSADHALVCLHHHPVKMGSLWLDGVGLRNHEEFFAVVDNQPKVRSVLWGHVHQASDHTRKNVRLLSSPSTCSQFQPNSDSFVLDSRPPAYRWLNLNADGNIDTEISWIQNI
ncbi:MAG: 3',5'-cyclic-AMP phosphodiesterase [Gammaproteobacteria bacterium]